METLRLSAPQESVERRRSPVVQMATDIVSILEEKVTLDDLLDWAEDPYDEREAEILRSLHSSVLSVTKSDPEEITYSQFTNLVGNLVDACGTVDKPLEGIHEYLSTKIPDIENLLEQNNYDGIDQFVSIFSILNTPDTDKFILNHFAEAIVKASDRTDHDWIFGEFFVDKRSDLVPSIVQGFSHVLTDWKNIDSNVEEKVSEWCNNYFPLPEEFISVDIDHLQTLKEHVKTMVSLEQKAKGSTKYLIDEYNIHCFSWYPEEMLLDQYEQRNEKTNRPQGILLGTLHDWNNSNRRSNKSSTYERFYNQVKNAGYEMRAAEVATRDELLYMAYKEVKDHGQLDFAVVDGHANTFLIGLGERPEDVITYNDFSSKASNIVTDAIKPGGTIVLSGCNLGQIGGFAQKLSERGFTVIASNSPSNLRGLTFYPEESPPIDASFISSIHFQVYNNGDLISDRGERVF